MCPLTRPSLGLALRNRRRDIAGELHQTIALLPPRLRRRYSLCHVIPWVCWRVSKLTKTKVQPFKNWVASLRWRHIHVEYAVEDAAVGSRPQVVKFLQLYWRIVSPPRISRSWRWINSDIRISTPRATWSPQNFVAMHNVRVSWKAKVRSPHIREQGACLWGWPRSSAALLGCTTSCLRCWPAWEPISWDAKSILTHSLGKTPFHLVSL
jgi:hypothetical protein